MCLPDLPRASTFILFPDRTATAVRSGTGTLPSECRNERFYAAAICEQIIRFAIALLRSVTR